MNNQMQPYNTPITQSVASVRTTIALGKNNEGKDIANESVARV